MTNAIHDRDALKIRALKNLRANLEKPSPFVQIQYVSGNDEARWKDDGGNQFAKEEETT